MKDWKSKVALRIKQSVLHSYIRLHGSVNITLWMHLLESLDQYVNTSNYAQA